VLLVRADHDLEGGIFLFQGRPVLFFEGAERLDAIGEMDGVDAELGEGFDTAEKFFRPGERRTAGTVDDPDKVERFSGRIIRKGAAALAQVGKTADRRAAQVQGCVRTGEDTDARQRIPP